MKNIKGFAILITIVLSLAMIMVSCGDPEEEPVAESEEIVTEILSNTVSWEGTCTTCGKKQNLTTGGDPNRLTNSGNHFMPGKCPNTIDGKHVVMWQLR